MEAAAEGGSRADCGVGCGWGGGEGGWRDAGGGEAVDFPEKDPVFFGGAGEDEVVVEFEAGKLVFGLALWRMRKESGEGYQSTKSVWTSVLEKCG